MTAWLVAGLLSLVGGPSAAAVSEEELLVLMNALGDSLMSCDVAGLGSLLATDVQIIFVDDRETRSQTRRAFLSDWEAFCRSRGVPDEGFRVLNSSMTAGSQTATMRFTLTKEYQLGLVRRRRIKATLNQEFTVKETAQHRLEVKRLYERSEYRDLADDRIIPWEEAVPIPPLTRFTRLLLGRWLLPADREASDEAHAKP